MIVDRWGGHHQVNLLGTEKIGRRCKLPEKVFLKICQELQLDPNMVSNIDSDIDLIIGIDTPQLLAERVRAFYPQTADPTLQDVVVMQSALSPGFFLVGALGTPLTINPLASTVTFFNGQN